MRNYNCSAISSLEASDDDLSRSGKWGEEIPDGEERETCDDDETEEEGRSSDSEEFLFTVWLTPAQRVHWRPGVKLFDESEPNWQQ